MGGRAQHEVGHHHLRLCRFEFGGHVGRVLGRRAGAVVQFVGALRGLGRAQRDRLGRVGPGRHFAHHLQDLRIVAGARGVAVAVDPLALAHQAAGVAFGRARDAGQRRQMEQLIERGLVAKAPREVDQAVRIDAGLGEARRAAAGGALAEAVPVVDQRDAGLGRGDGRDHRRAVGLALRVHVDPVREQAAGGVELLAVDDPALVTARDAGARLAERRLAGFAPGVADQLPGREAGEPGVARGAGRRVEPVLDECEMAAQRLRQVRIGGGELDQQAQQLRDRGAEAARGRRHAQRAEAGLPEPADRLDGQRAVAVALHGAAGDAREDGPETRGERVVVGAGRAQGDGGGRHGGSS